MKKYFETTVKYHESTGIMELGITEVEAESKPQDFGYDNSSDGDETHMFWDSRKEAEWWLANMESENAMWTEVYGAGYEVQYI